MYTPTEAQQQEGLYKNPCGGLNPPLVCTTGILCSPLMLGNLPLAPLSGVTSAMKLGISGHTRNLAGHPPYATSVIHAGDSARSGNSLPAEARP